MGEAGQQEESFKEAVACSQESAENQQDSYPDGPHHVQAKSTAEPWEDRISELQQQLQAAHERVAQLDSSFQDMIQHFDAQMLKVEDDRKMLLEVCDLLVNTERDSKRIGLHKGLTNILNLQRRRSQLQVRYSLEGKKHGTFSGILSEGQDKRVRPPPLLRAGVKSKSFTVREEEQDRDFPECLRAQQNLRGSQRIFPDLRPTNTERSLVDNLDDDNSKQEENENEQAEEDEQCLYYSCAQNAFGAWIHVGLQAGLQKALKLTSLMVFSSVFVQSVLSLQLLNVHWTSSEWNSVSLCNQPMVIQMCSTVIFVVLMLNNVPGMWKAAVLVMSTTHHMGGDGASVGSLQHADGGGMLQPITRFV
jgi:chaperonin cofactor prefoldin